MNPKYPQRIVFYYDGELRACYAPEIVLAITGVDYSHWWPIEFRDGNALNTDLLNMKITHPDHKGKEFGFMSKTRSGTTALYEGIFPAKDGKIIKLGYLMEWDETPPSENPLEGRGGRPSATP